MLRVVGRVGRVVLGGLFAGLLLVPAPAHAQDALTVAPQVFKKVNENARMRVLEATFRPGEKVGVHSLPDHLLYMLTAGSLTLKPPDRTPYEITFNAGDALFLPAQTRATENDGQQTVRVLIVELKTGTPVQARRGGKGKRTGRGKRGRRK